MDVPDDRKSIGGCISGLHLSLTKIQRAHYWGFLEKFVSTRLGTLWTEREKQREERFLWMYKWGFGFGHRCSLISGHYR